MIAIGFLIIWKSEKVFSWIGEIAWAEEHLGAGYSRSFIKLMGLAIIIIAFLFMIGTVEGVLTRLFKPKQQIF